MKSIDDKMLSAYIDNELSPEDRQITEDALSNSESLQQRLQILQGPDLAMREAFTELDNTPMPTGLEDLIRGPINSDSENTQDNVVPLPRKIPAPAWGIAASVILGVVFFLQYPQPLAVSEELNQFANHATSGSIIKEDGWRAELVMSFELNNGTRCREIRKHTPETTTTLQACGAPNDWEWQMIEQDTLYHTATGELTQPSNILSIEAEKSWLGLKD